MSWTNLPSNSGSHSAPHNEGIRLARRPWIAYLGHDDIWAPDHLEAILEVIDSDPPPGFVVSGCVFYGPDGSDIHWVTGLFTGDDAPLHHVFPPSSFAHRRRVPDMIGEWQDPASVAPPPDADFLLRAARAGLRFRSTGRVTVHKFAAGHRYLSYVRPRSDEQRVLLESLDRLDDGHVERLIEKSTERERFMAMRYPDFQRYAAGFLFEANRWNKGLKRPPLRPLSGRTVIEQTDEPRALDWYALETDEVRFRWSGPSPRPRILIPYSGGRVRIRIHVPRVPMAVSLDGVSVFVEEQEVDRRVEKEEDGASALVFSTELRPRDETVVTLSTPAMFSPHDVTGNGDHRLVGVPVGDLVIEPLDSPG
jgi:hypothetical protein